ncbi:MAG TPA: aminoglycoside phosphotransferase family protein [Candidatus Saccharimonadia bacterium]|jgi:Ser/Thr protein kinase RdoA (MazF antagonist)|nr:aminoglycoside phosphotransferase family protein [Candidatus Saccharimonadia bacterium]
MTPEAALDYINAAKSTHYTVAGQFSGGENQGAFRVSSADGKEAVLKISANPMWRSQIERAKAATDHLRPMGYPVPTYQYIDAISSGTFWLEDIMPGEAVTAATPDHIKRLLELIELQKGQTISAVQGQDWSWFAMGVVFRGDSGYVRNLMQFSTETSALAAQIEGLVLGLDGKALGNTDLVHGEYNLSQVLATGPTITAILDWDQAGYGDRTMDLVGLWYSLMDQPAARDQVFEHMTKVSDPQIIKIFAAYRMLTTLATNMNKPGGEVANASQQAKTALGLLHNL